MFFFLVKDIMSVMILMLLPIVVILCYIVTARCLARALNLAANPVKSCMII